MSKEKDEGTAYTPRKQLGFAKAFKVSQWIGCNQERILGELPTYTEAAQWASKDLGFDVTEANMRSVADGAGQTWTPKRGPSKGSGSSNLWAAINRATAKSDEAAHLIEQLLTDNQNLHAQCAQLRGALVALAKEAKCSPPPFASKNDAPRTPVVNK